MLLDSNLGLIRCDGLAEEYKSADSNMIWKIAANKPKTPFTIPRVTTTRLGASGKSPGIGLATWSCCRLRFVLIPYKLFLEASVRN